MSCVGCNTVVHISLQKMHRQQRNKKIGKSYILEQTPRDKRFPIGDWNRIELDKRALNRVLRFRSANINYSDYDYRDSEATLSCSNRRRRHRVASSCRRVA